MQVKSFRTIEGLFDSLTPPRLVPTLEPGEVLGFWDMYDMPGFPGWLVEGSYITQDGRYAKVTHVDKRHHQGLGYVRDLKTGIDRPCVWEFMGLVVCSYFKTRDKNDKYIEGLDLVAPWSAGIKKN